MPDEERPLTAKGEKQARLAAAWLRKRLPKDTLTLVSPARRAQQTARVLTKQFETRLEVGTGASAQAILRAAGWPGRGGTVLVVGHQPALGQAAALALTGQPSDWSIRNGAIWWLASRERENAVLRAVIAPDLV